MDTHEVERIRARVEQGGIVPELYGLVGFALNVQDLELARSHAQFAGEGLDHDLRTLLRILDAQAAVIAAAGEVAADMTAANWYEDAFTYVVDAEKLETLKREYDALAALKGAGDGE